MRNYRILTNRGASSPVRSAWPGDRLRHRCQPITPLPPSPWVPRLTASVGTSAIRFSPAPTSPPRATKSGDAAQMRSPRWGWTACICRPGKKARSPAGISVPSPRNGATRAAHAAVSAHADHRCARVHQNHEGGRGGGDNHRTDQGLADAANPRKGRGGRPRLSPPDPKPPGCPNGYNRPWPRRGGPDRPGHKMCDRAEAARLLPEAGLSVRKRCAPAALQRKCGTHRQAARIPPPRPPATSCRPSIFMSRRRRRRPMS